MGRNLNTGRHRNNPNIMSLRTSGRGLQKVTDRSIDITGDGVAEGVTETVTPGSGNKQVVVVSKDPGYQRTVVDRTFEDVIGAPWTSSLFNQLNAYWKLDEASGTRFDVLGVQHLTENSANVIGTSDGKIGRAAQLVKTDNEYLSRASNSVLATGGESFSIAGWIYIDTDATMAFCSKWSASKREFLCQYSANKFRLYVSSDGVALFSITSNEVVAPSSWYFVYMVYDKENELFGLSVNNGALKTSAHTVGVHSDDADFLLSGSNAGTTSIFDGRIDELGYWARVLTADERTILYNRGAGRTYPFVVP